MPPAAATAPRPAPPQTPEARVAAAAASLSLYERKLKLFDQLGTNDLQRELAAEDEAYLTAFRNQIDIKVRIEAAKAALDEAETLAALNAPAEGKNAEARKLEREQAVLNDAASKDARQVVRELESQLLRLDPELETHKRRGRRLERQIDARISALRFLGD